MALKFCVSFCTRITNFFFFVLSYFSVFQIDIACYENLRVECASHPSEQPSQTSLSSHGLRHDDRFLVPVGCGLVSGCVGGQLRPGPNRDKRPRATDHQRHGLTPFHVVAVFCC